MNIKPECWWCRNTHCRHRTLAATKIRAEQMRAPALHERLSGRETAGTYLVPCVSISHVTGTENTRNMISPLVTWPRLEDVQCMECLRRLPVAKEANVTVVPIWVGVVH